MDTSVMIFDVREKEVGPVNPPSFPLQTSRTTGFPQPKSRARVSAFKKNREELERSARDKADQKPHRPPPTAGHVDPEDEERRAIDRENQARLDAMSAEEIAAAQKELFSHLDPKLITSLLSRATLDDDKSSQWFTGAATSYLSGIETLAPDKETPGTDVAGHAQESRPRWSVAETEPRGEPKPKKTVTFEDAEPVVATNLVPASQPAEKTDEATHGHTTHFPHPPKLPHLDPADPDFLENLRQKFFPDFPADPSKLAWMAPLPTPHSAADRESPYYPGQDSLPVSQLRFDFRGALVPPALSRAIPVTEGLHHHGEAPEAAGYTIPELARLARSSVPAQRCVAFQALGRILYRLGRGEWGVGEGGRSGEEDDLAFGLWRCFRETRVLESLGEAAAAEDGAGHRGSKVYAIEALWLYEKGGWKERWRGM